PAQPAESEQHQPLAAEDAGRLSGQREASIGQRADRDSLAREVGARLLDFGRAHPRVALGRPPVEDGVGHRFEALTMLGGRHRLSDPHVDTRYSRARRKLKRKKLTRPWGKPVRRIRVSVASARYAPAA